MARKSNKTAHVLGLITNEKKETPSSMEEQAPISSNTAQTIEKTDTSPLSGASSSKTSVPMLEISEEGNSQVSDAIRNTLIQELFPNDPELPLKNQDIPLEEKPIYTTPEYENFEEEPLADKQASYEEEAPALSTLDDTQASQEFLQQEEGTPTNALPKEEPALEETSISEVLPISEDVLRNALAETEGFEIVSQKISEEIQKENEHSDPIPPGELPEEHQKESNQEKENSANSLPEERETKEDYSAPAFANAPVVSDFYPTDFNAPICKANNPMKNPELKYAYINVAEQAVTEKVLEYMNRFHMCTCDRCVVDTIALALTYLPSKYIVTHRENAYALINYYTLKYNIQIVSELTKACMVVSQQPHHAKNI